MWTSQGVLICVLLSFGLGILIGYLMLMTAKRDLAAREVGHILGLIFRAYAELPRESFFESSSFLQTFKIVHDSLDEWRALAVVDGVLNGIAGLGVKKLEVDPEDYARALDLYDKLFHGQERGYVTVELINFGNHKDVLVVVDSEGRIFGGIDPF